MRLHDFRNDGVISVGFKNDCVTDVPGMGNDHVACDDCVIGVPGISES